MDGEAAFLSVPSSNGIELNQFTSIFVCIFIIIPSKFFQKENLLKRTCTKFLCQDICGSNFGTQGLNIFWQNYRRPKKNMGFLMVLKGSWIHQGLKLL